MRRHPWLVASLLAVLGVLVLGSFPARAYLDQLDQREDLERRTAALDVANAELADKAAYLGTDEAVERLARQRYQLVRPGEEAYAILPGPADPKPETPSDLPPPVVLEEADPSWWDRTADALTFWD